MVSIFLEFSYETATLKKTKKGFQDQLSLNAGQKHCRMLQREHSAILSTFIKLPIDMKTFVLSYLSGCFTQVLLYAWVKVFRINSEFRFLFVCLFCCFTSQVNSYGHGGTVSSPNHTFSWASLNKQLTSTSCSYFPL